MPPGLLAPQAITVLTGYQTGFRWVQLHIGQPGPTGTANVAQESTRVQTTWGAPTLVTPGSTSTPGRVEMPSTVETLFLSAAAGEDYAFFSAWSTATNGTCGFTGVIQANAVLVGDDFRIPAGALLARFNVAA